MVVADQRSPRDGRVIETVGRYNAQRQPSEIVLDRERIDHWIARGAQPTGTVRKLMRAAERNGAGAPAPSAAPPSVEESPGGEEPAPADEGTPVPIDEPSEEEGPADEAPAEAAPPAGAGAAGATPE